VAAPKEPRIDKTYQYGSFKSSIKDLNAPLIFLVGGLNVPVSQKADTLQALPGDYMWGTTNKLATGYEKGFSRCSDFNVYNVTQVARIIGGSNKSDTNGLKNAAAECQKILSDIGSTPSKKIMVGFSKGTEPYNNVISSYGGWNNWDLVLMGGIYSPSGEGAGIDGLVRDLGKYSKKMYYFSSNNDGTGPKATERIKNALSSDPTHYIENPFGAKKHSALPNAMATWILNNVSVNKTAQSSNPPPHDPVNPSGTDGTGSGAGGAGGTDGGAGGTDGGAGGTDGGAGGTDGGAGGAGGTNEGGGGGQDGGTPGGTEGTSVTSGENPVTSGNDCGDLTKLDAKKKADNAPEGAPDDVKAKDPIPPPKNAAPVSSDSKYNHRYYLIPLKDNQPMSLADMVKKENKYHKRYWAWRPDEGRGFGNQKFEYTVTSDTGISLIAGLCPYWPPPKDANDNDTKPTINGEWSNLISGQKTIESFLDIPILLNAYDVGVYNNNIEYVFEAGNELHMTLINSSLVRNKGSQLAIGQSDNTDIVEGSKKDSSWRHWPKWSGIWVSHCLKKSGYSLQSNIEGNIDDYHIEILKKDKLLNYPGNKDWKWKELKSAGMQDLVFKPSKIWLDPTNLNSEELIKDKGDIAIFIPDFHFTKDGGITEKGKKLLDKLIKLNWKLAVISAVRHHTTQSNQLYAEVLTYLNGLGDMITIGGNTTPKGADSSVSQTHHIAIKSTNFKEFAQMSNDTWVNGAIFISNVKSAPDGHREGGIDSKIYVSSIFKDYYERIDKEPGKLTSRMYDILQPYLSLKETKPVEEPKADEPKVETLREQHTPIPATDGGETIRISYKDALAKGLIVPIPSKYGSSEFSFLRPDPAKRWLAMQDYMQTIGYSLTVPKETGKRIGFTSLFRSNQYQAYLWGYTKTKAGIVKRSNTGVSPDPGPGRNDAADKGEYIAWRIGKPDNVAPPVGPEYTTDPNTPGSKRISFNKGSWHQWGRAVDSPGTFNSSIGQAGLGKNYQAYWTKATEAQKWITLNGYKWGWYPYAGEVWHIYDNNKKDVDTMKNVKLL
jgi:hypothetical protein